MPTIEARIAQLTQDLDAYVVTVNQEVAFRTGYITALRELLSQKDVPLQDESQYVPEYVKKDERDAV